MTLSDIKTLPLLQTRTIAQAAEDPDTHAYIVECLLRFLNGDYGLICAEDTDANNADLAAGCGHILAKYAGKYELTGDIYIEAHFDSEHMADIDYSQIMIMYPAER